MIKDRKALTHCRHGDSKTPRKPTRGRRGCGSRQRVKSGIHALVKVTHGPEVLGKIGGFGGLFRAEISRA